MSRKNNSTDFIISEKVLDVACAYVFEIFNVLSDLRSLITSAVPDKIKEEIEIEKKNKIK